MTEDNQTYPPLNTLKRVAENVWIVDGPLIRFGPPGLKMPFPTRMTVVRLDDGSLFLHSPTALTPALKADIEKAGTPRWIVGPNRLHYWWIPDWKSAFPHADVYLAPRIREQAGARIAFATCDLDVQTGYPWDRAIATLPIAGSYMTEVEFFHHASRTLILTDFIENFEPRKLGFLMRWLTRFGGVQAPDGQMPRDMRFSFRNQKRELKAAVETMIAWNPERIIIAHGLWYDKGAAAELRRAFRWILDAA
ncbi:MAG TPA: DUF4336 domain-containing protein [Xanthobacteraceae bacterium]|jgi:hypothetical protein|nr:DUF4336 domain-containing protein [Xanthobacteraceae bacterium]